MQPTNAPARLNADTVARFARELGALAAPGARVLVAVSGGPDSIALLLLAHEALGERCVAATVDHRLRAASGDEAAWVARLCAARGIAHATLTGPLPDRAGRTANVSARARALRYTLLEAEADRVGAGHIATAHHADDQIETLVMRLNRGAGIAGLAGVRAKGGRIVRPLLGWRKAELVELVAAQGIASVDDPSNVSDRFDRARLRKALAGVDWLDAGRWTVSARALGDAEDALAWMVRHLESAHVFAEGSGLLLFPDDLPFELCRRLTIRVIDRIDPATDLRGPALADAVRGLRMGRPIMLGNVGGRPKKMLGGQEAWYFSPAPPRRPC